MNPMRHFLWAILFVAFSSSAAQLYRWVDSKGNVEWRDTPPPTSTPMKNVEQRKLGNNVIGTGETPYSLQQATTNHPVTLWATDCGPACTSARAHLSRRGIPYTDKSPQTDPEGFKKVSPASEVPILMVGKIPLRGYLESEWDTTLDSAGYPRTAVPIRAKPAAPAPKPASDGTAPTTPASAK